MLEGSQTRRWRGGLPSTSIAAKMALVMSALSIVAVIVLTAFMYNGTIRLLYDEEVQRLKGVVDTEASRLQAGINFYRKDVEFLTGVPPVTGIMRASAAGGMDVAGGSSQFTWQSRLATIFIAMMRSHPEYDQVRLIGVTNGGREIVRVNRTARGTLERTPEHDLQIKSDRPYYAATLSVPPGAIYMSDIELNVENGQIEVPHRPVMRVATSVADEEGMVFGIIIINISVRALVETVVGPKRQGSTYLTNQDGDFLVHPDPDKTFGFDLGQRYLLQQEFPALAGLFAEGGTRLSGKIDDIEDQQLFEAARVYIDPVHPQRFITLTEMSSQSLLAGKINEIRNNTIILAGILLLLQLAAVAWVSVLLTRPVRKITVAAQAVAKGSREVDLASLTGRRDETGDLARSFAAMLDNISAKEAELNKKAEELARSNQELSQFAYVASHDLQEPLRMVGSFLSLLQKRYASQLNAEANEFVDFAVDGANRMKTLINDLLGYSRISNSLLHVGKVDLVQTLSGIVDLLRPQIEETQAKITWSNMPVLHADGGQMERLFRNLIENALKYRSEAPPEITISARQQGSAWAFAVADNGIGIDPIHSEKVFAIFTRLHSRAKYQGTGIGLAACRRIVERHGGKISVEPNVGGGSVFRFTLSADLPLEESADG